jgi:hypothetical protein
MCNATRNWRIKSINEVDEDGDPLYWSNEFGWTERKEAERFDEGEKNAFNLPMGGEWELRTTSQPVRCDFCQHEILPVDEIGTDVGRCDNCREYCYQCGEYLEETGRSGKCDACQPVRCDWCDCEVESRDQLTDASTLKEVGPREFVGDICQSCLLRHCLEAIGACDDALALNWSPDCDCDACTKFRACL